MQRADLEQQLVVDVAQAFHRSGAPAHLVEDGVTAAAAAFGLAVEVFATPTALHVHFGPDKSWLFRVSPKGPHLARLSLLEELTEQMRAGALSLAEARAKLDRVERVGEPHSVAATRAAHGAVAGAVAVLLGGGLVEVASAAALGLLAGVLMQHLAPFENARRAAFLFAAFGAGTVGTWYSSTGVLSGSIVVLAGLIVLFPGNTSRPRCPRSSPTTWSLAPPG